MIKAINGILVRNYQSYPLDLISNTSLVAAWSNRKLSQSYLGNANQIRRSSDNATTDIGFSAGDYNTNALISHVGLNSGFINTWYDQSGNGRNLSQSTINLQPRIRNAGTTETLNGKVTIKGLSTESWLGGNIGLINSNTFTLTLVMSVPSFVQYNKRIVSTTFNDNSDWQLTSTFNINLSSTNTVEVNQNSSSFSSNISSNTPVVYTILWNGAFLKIRRNGVEINSFNNTNSLYINKITLFALPNTVQYIDCFISECMIYARTLNTTELQLIERNMGTYYGITVA